MKKCVKLLVVGMLVGLFANISMVYAEAAGVESLSTLSSSGLYVSKDNYLYITDSYTNQIYKYDGVDLTLLAGNSNFIEGVPTGGYIDGIADYALFDSPYMALEWNGGVIVSDTENHVLRYIESSMVETYAGTGEAGHVDGLVGDSSFDSPTGLAVDDDGNLYIADTGNGVIRMMTTGGIVTTYTDEMNGPTGLFWYDGALYVTDTESNEILKVVNGEVTVVAGLAIQDEEGWIGGYQDGSVEEAMFSLPEGIYVDDTGIYVGDTGNNTVREIVDGEVYTIYDGENLADSTSITKYKGDLLIGDPFLRTTQVIEELTITNQAVEVEEELEEVIETEASMEEELEVIVEVAHTYWSLIAILGAVLIVVLITIVVLLKKDSSNKKRLKMG